MATPPPPPPPPNQKKSISDTVFCAIFLVLVGVTIGTVVFLIVLIEQPPDFPTFKIESVSLSTTPNNNNTAVWDLGLLVEKLHGWKIEDLTVWARCKPSLEWSGKFIGPFYMEDKDSGLGNVTLATVLTPEQVESKVLDCGVMFMGWDYTFFTALCKNVNVEAETAGRWIMVGDESRLCPQNGIRAAVADDGLKAIASAE
ncbi:hybrid signal transduction histidine kinase J [Striga asiatica]|uniref:Hybrid signal transduction histidine kinase J n=1 Tax=Striga asiatica TaxID=4170 RepID=A0A5A7RA94_STRAF|nr:hybrid signal transduction histidine kinase J [Striga asiatica]